LIGICETWCFLVSGRRPTGRWRGLTEYAVTTLRTRYGRPQMSSWYLLERNGCRRTMVTNRPGLRDTRRNECEEPGYSLRSSHFRRSGLKRQAGRKLAGPGGGEGLDCCWTTRGTARTPKTALADPLLTRSEESRGQPEHKTPSPEARSKRKHKRTQGSWVIGASHARGDSTSLESNLRNLCGSAPSPLASAKPG
jgi:hypothetical protein